MNRWPSRKEVESIRARYKAGTRIELVRMEDLHAPPVGTRGTIVAVDDIGDLIVKWDNGSSLNLIPGIDEFKIIKEETERG